MIGPRRYVLLWLDTATREVAICETERGVCYQSFPSLTLAQAEADACNEDATRFGWPSCYRPIPAPDGLTLAP